MWSAFQDGATIEKKGSEEGIIVRDEEHESGSRITLESKTTHAPFAITCGIYGLMLHTAFASSDMEATKKYEEMKTWLDEMLRDDMTEDERLNKLQSFVNTF